MNVFMNVLTKILTRCQLFINKKVQILGILLNVNNLSDLYNKHVFNLVCMT